MYTVQNMHTKKYITTF